MSTRYSPDGLSSSLSSRLVRKVSDSVGSFRNKKRIRFESDLQSAHFEERHPLRRTTKFSYDDRARNVLPVRPTSVNIDGSHDNYQRTSEASESNPFRRRRHSHTLETVVEVPSSSTSRRTTIVDANRPELDLATPEGQDTQTPRLHRQHSSAGSDMHQSVNSGDYLLARGANPRTGVVTPAHSANSSLDDHTAVQTQQRPPRWRQRGDQWISLDLGEPTPVSTTPSATPPEQRHHALRTPQKLTTEKQRESLRSSSLVQDAGLPNGPQQPAVKFQLDQEVPAHTVDGNRVTPIQQGLRRDSPVKRKPVGSPPSKAETTPQGPASSEDSTDTVLRKPNYHDNLRSSSAPGPFHIHLFDLNRVDKDLPSIPPQAKLEDGIEYGNDPFLGLRGTMAPANIPIKAHPKPSGPQLSQKELPCLPTSNGQSQSKLPNPPYPMTNVDAGVPNQLQTRVEAPQGPREGGNLTYPYIRTTKQTYPSSPPTNQYRPAGERAMPIPIYDNPPKHPSPLAREVMDQVDGPRSMPLPALSVPEKTRLLLSPWSNTTTTLTDMSIRSGLPAPLRIGPRTMRPDLRTDRGQKAFHHKVSPSGGSVIIMNTTMNMTTDSMMSIPMPRIRPRALTRPIMPTRAEGMYGIPKIDMARERSATDTERQRPTIPMLDQRRQEIQLMPEPLKPRTLSKQDQDDHTEQDRDQTEAKSTNRGLMRKCSRCDHGLVDVKLHNTDSVIHMSDLQKDVAEAEEGISQLHPSRSPLPQEPEISGHAEHEEIIQCTVTPTQFVADERNHNICCPECCKLDCHEGCLGHPSPTASPSPVNSIWSEEQTLVGGTGASTPTTGSEVSERATPERFGEKVKAKGLELAKAVLKVPVKQDQGSKSGSHLQSVMAKTCFDLAVQPPTPVTHTTPNARQPQAGAVAAALTAIKPRIPQTTTGAVPPALSAMGLAQRKVPAPRPMLHKRQRSNSMPVIGIDIRKTSGSAESYRAFSSSRLRIPSPVGLALSCVGLKFAKNVSRSRNASGTSIATIEVPIPNFASLATGGGGNTALSEILSVPLEAMKMWIRTHPQMLTMGHELFHRAWEMAQVMTGTAWRLWAVVFVYSKTGKIQFHVNKAESASGFMVDVARSGLYFLIFAAVSALIVRVLGLVFGVMRIGLWVFQGAFWIVGSILGVGAGTK